ncbi:unnamed protein product, partial [Mesorhabditis spiculigera]
MILRLPLLLGLVFLTPIDAKPSRSGRAKRRAHCDRSLKHDGSEWHCGNGAASYLGSIALSLMSFDTQAINRCCAHHDYNIDCLMTRAEADEEFDRCLNKGNFFTRIFTRPVMVFCVKSFPETPDDAFEKSPEYMAYIASVSYNSTDDSMDTKINASPDGYAQTIDIPEDRATSEMPKAEPLIQASIDRNYVNDIMEAEVTTTTTEDPFEASFEATIQTAPDSGGLVDVFGNSTEPV